MATRSRRDPIRLFWRRLGIVALVIGLAVALWAVLGVYWKERESRQLRDDAERQAHDLSQQTAALSASIAKLQTDRGKEEVLRENYNEGALGEHLIILVDRDTPKPVEATSTGFGAFVHKWFSFW